MSARAGLTVAEAIERAALDARPASGLAPAWGALDVLLHRLRSGEWRATGFLHADALEPEPVPPRWWHELAAPSIFGDDARGGGREVTALRILAGDGIEAEAPQPQPERQPEAKPATMAKATKAKAQAASAGSIMDRARARYLRHLADFGLDPADPEAMPPSEDASARALPKMPRKVLRAVRVEVWGDRATKRGPRR